MQVQEITYVAQSPSTSVTNYYIVGIGATGTISIQAESQISRRSAGTFSKMSINLTTGGTGAGGTGTLNFQVNGANGNQAVSWNVGTTGLLTDSSHSDTVSSGDLVNYAINLTSFTAAPAPSNISVIFVSGDGKATVREYAATSGAGPSFTGSSANDTSPAGSIRAACGQGWTVQSSTTVHNLFAYVVTDSIGSGTTTVGSLVNGFPGNLSLSIAAAATGAFEDLVHSDLLKPDDVIAFRTIAGLGGSVFFRSIASEFTSTDGSYMYGGIGDPSTTQVTGPIAIVGNSLSTGAAPAAFTIPMILPYMMTYMECYLSYNSDASTSTIAANVNNIAIPSFSISIPNNSIGRFTNSQSSVSLVLLDQVYLSLTTNTAIHMTLVAISNFSSDIEMLMFDLAPGTCVSWGE